MQNLMTEAISMCVMNTLDANNEDFHLHEQHFGITFLVNVVKKPRNKPRIAMFCPSAVYQTSDFFLPPVTDAVHAMYQVMSKERLRGEYDGIECFNECDPKKFVLACKFNLDVTPADAKERPPKITDFVPSMVGGKPAAKKNRGMKCPADGTESVDARASTSGVDSITGGETSDGTSAIAEYLLAQQQAAQAAQARAILASSYPASYVPGSGLSHIGMDPLSAAYLSPGLMFPSLWGVGVLSSAPVMPSASLMAAAILPGHPMTTTPSVPLAAVPASGYAKKKKGADKGK